MVRYYCDKCGKECKDYKIITEKILNDTVTITVETIDGKNYCKACLIMHSYAEFEEKYQQSKKGK